MANIKKMTAQQLKTWVRNLEDSIKADSTPENQEIYKKWLKEAKEEQQARQERRQAWWDCRQKGMFGG